MTTSEASNAASAARVTARIATIMHVLVVPVLSAATWVGLAATVAAKKEVVVAVAAKAKDPENHDQDDDDGQIVIISKSEIREEISKAHDSHLPFRLDCRNLSRSYINIILRPSLFGYRNLRCSGRKTWFKADEFMWWKRMKKASSLTGCIISQVNGEAFLFGVVSLLGLFDSHVSRIVFLWAEGSATCSITGIGKAIAR